MLVLSKVLTIIHCSHNLLAYFLSSRLFDAEQYRFVTVILSKCMIKISSLLRLILNRVALGMTRFGEHNIACGQIIVNSDSLGSRLLVLDLVQVLKVTLVTATGILCLQFYCFKSLPFGLLLDNLEVLSRSSTYPIQKD